MILLHLQQGFLAENDQIFILFYLAGNTVIGQDILADLPVDQSGQQGPSDVLHGLHGFLIVIDVDKTYGQALVVNFLEGQADRRIVRQGQGDQGFLPCIVKIAGVPADAGQGQKGHFGYIALRFEIHADTGLLSL